MSKPLIAVGSLGGTIAMAPGASGGVLPSLDAHQLIAGVPGIETVANIRAASIQNVASPSLQFSDLFKALDFAYEQVENGARGVVLTHGTDTLEESAYFFDLFWDRPEPIIVTGAMRPPGMLGADGSANILAATIAAVEPKLRNFGALVVLDDEVHVAKHVTKSHANALWAFQSRDWGPVARIHERRVRVALEPHERNEPLPRPRTWNMTIPILEAGLGANRKYLDAVAQAGITGCVIAGSGVGHVPVPVVDACEDMVRSGIPVVFATRQGSGTTGTCSYDYPGSEMDAIRRGIIMAGYLSPRKARILLWALTNLGYALEDIAREFAVRGE